MKPSLRRRMAMSRQLLRRPIRPSVERSCRRCGRAFRVISDASRQWYCTENCAKYTVRDRADVRTEQTTPRRLSDTEQAELLAHDADRIRRTKP